MKNKIEKNNVEKKLVLKVLPNEILLSTTSNPEQFQIKSNIIRWKLPKKIDPNDINNDLEFLSDNLDRMVKAYQLEGHAVTTLIPHSISPLKTIDIPMDLTTASDKKEYHALSKASYEFWKEHDERLVEIKEAEIRAEFLKLNDSDGSSKMLYAAAPSKFIRDYITLILGGNLYPVAFIPEDQSVIKAIEARLTRVERERSFCIFHLSKSNNRIIYVSDGNVQIARVDISDLDETLLDEIPSNPDELENDFWKEVSLRLSTNLKQAFTFLKEELKISKVDTIFFVSDHPNESAIFKIFNKNFRLANFRSLANQFVQEFMPKPKPHNIFDKKVSDDLTEGASEVGSQIIPLMGCYQQKYFSTPSFQNKLIEIALFNLHPKQSFIENNFKLYKPMNIGMKISFMVLLISSIIFGMTHFTADQKNVTETLFNNLDSELKNKQGQMNRETQSIQLLKNDTNKIYQAKIGNQNKNLILLINYDLPQDLELDRLIVRGSNFIMYGNGKTISEINRFYEKLLNNSKFKDLNFNAYKRADSNLNFFEIKGQVE